MEAHKIVGKVNVLMILADEDRSMITTQEYISKSIQQHSASQASLSTFA